MRTSWLDRAWGMTVALAIVGIVTGSVVACDSLFGSDDADGGAGADFDGSLYYTKTDTDTLLNNVIRSGTESAQTLAGVDWAGKTPVGFAVPDGVSGAMVEVVVGNGSATDAMLYIQFSGDATGADLVVQAKVGAGLYNSFLGYTRVPAGSSTLYGWHDTIHSEAVGSLTGIDVSVRPVLWFR
jgi:hypothetical protein